MLRPGIIKILKDNEGMINNIFGSLDNIHVRNSYADAMNDLQKKDAYYNGYKSYLDTDKKMNGYQLTDYDKSILTQPNEKFADLSQMTAAAPEYQSYLNDPTKPQDYIKYLKDKHPDTYNNYVTSGVIVQQPKNITEQDVLKMKYNRLGITPEQQKTYEQFRATPFDYDNYNRQLQNYGLEMYPNLISTGSLGNTIANTYMQGLQGHMVKKPDTTHYKVDEDKNGNIYMYNDIDPTGTFKIIKPGTEKQQKQDWKPYSDLSYQIFKNDDGTYNRRSYLVNSDGEIKEMITPSNEDEFKSYMTNLNPPVQKTSYHGTSRKGREKTADEWKAEAYYGEGGLDNYLNDLWSDIQNSSESGMTDLKNKWQSEADYVWKEWGRIKSENPNMNKTALNDIYNDIKQRMEIMGGIVISGNKKLYGNPKRWGEK
jgi:hypothetical protein